MQEKSRPRGRTGLPSPKTVHHNNPIPPEPSHRPDGTLQHQWSRKYKAPKTSLQETTPGRPIENENIAKLGPRIVRSNLENPISIIKGNGNKVPLQIPGGICVGRGGRKMCYRALPGLAKNLRNPAGSEMGRPTDEHFWPSKVLLCSTKNRLLFFERL